MTTLIKLKAHTPVITNNLEIELLLCCAQTRINQSTAEAIQNLVEQDVNWEYLLELAGRQGVKPLLYQSLQSTCPQAVPKRILQQLQNYFHANTIYSLFLTKELLFLLDFLDSKGIPAIPYKGPVLAASAYGKLSLRQCGDLDILVEPQNFLKAKNLLIDQGYQPVKPSCFLTEAQEIAYLQDRGEYSLMRIDSKVFVDLHQRITAKHFFLFPLDFEFLWERRQVVSLARSKVVNFCTEDLLIILCIHGSKHLWERLGWICDIAELIHSHQEIDWQELMEQAKRLGCSRMLNLGLFLTYLLLGVKLPESVHQSIQTDSVSPLLAAQIRQRLFSGVEDSTEGDSTEKFIFYFRMMERWQDKVWYCVGSIYRPLFRLIRPTLKDREFFALPPFLYSLYYLIRPIRMVSQLVISKGKATCN